MTRLPLDMTPLPVEITPLSLDGERRSLARASGIRLDVTRRGRRCVRPSSSAPVPQGHAIRPADASASEQAGRRCYSPRVTLSLGSRTAVTTLLLAACAAPAPAPTQVGSLPPSPRPSDASAPTGPSEAPAPSEDAAAVPISLDDATVGRRDALVTLVAFGDFQCPFTARSVPTLMKLASKYAPDDLRIVWKNEPLPFNTLARPVAEASQGVWALGGGAAFWRFLERAFAEQAHVSDVAIVGWAHETGVDMARFSEGMAAHAWAAKVDRDLVLSQQLRAGGTPSFFINGARLHGAQGMEKFEAVIDAELARARALVATGVPRDRVYALAASENARQWPPQEGATDAPDTAIHRVPVGASPVRGPKEALVTIVEFGDLQGPFTKGVEPALDAVRATYGDQVRVVWKNAPLPWHPRSRPAAELALEARAQKGDAGFWAAHDALFASQPKLDDADLDAVAWTLGLDAQRAASAVATKRYERTLVEDESLGDNLPVNSTPQFFINGRRLLSVRYDDLAKAVDAALARAREMVAKGVSRERVYDEIMKTALGPAAPERRVIPGAGPAPVRGAAGARVTIQELADFESPFAKSAEEPLAQVLQEYGGRVKLEWRSLPLPTHADAELAAEAALEAYAQRGDAGFWTMHDVLLANQSALGRASLDGYAASLGLDMGRFADALDRHAHKPAVDADAVAARAAGVTATPAFSIHGYYLSGAPSYVKLRKLVERALADGSGAKN